MVASMARAFARIAGRGPTGSHGAPEPELPGGVSTVLRQTGPLSSVP